jgi:hypothetical protein
MDVPESLEAPSSFLRQKAKNVFAARILRIVFGKAL